MTVQSLTVPDRVTHARLFAIAGPAMIANMTTPLLGLVGTAAIGQLGVASLLGGVALASIIFDFMFSLFAFLRMGTVALTAQALGARDDIEQRAVLVRALIVATGIGLVLIVCQQVVAAASFGLMGASPAVTAAANSYFIVRIWSAPFALGNFVLCGWLVGLARASTALALQVAINLANMLAMVVLIFAAHLGVVGVALGSVFGEAIGFAAGLLIAFALMRGHSALSRAVIFESARMLRMIGVNRDIILRTVALMIGFIYLFYAQGARAGDTALAANAVLHNFLLIGSFFLDGLAIAAQQLCGRAIGAKDRDAFDAASALVIGWGLAFGVATSAAFLAGGPTLIDLATTSPEVRAAAREFLLWAAIGPLAGALAYAFDGIYIGATWTRDMRNLMIGALLIYVGAWWELRGLGNAGLWIALLIFLMTRGLLQAVRYPALRRATFGGWRAQPALQR